MTVDVKAPGQNGRHSKQIQPYVYAEAVIRQQVLVVVMEAEFNISARKKKVLKNLIYGSK
jgi:hypothetical protein